MTIPGCSTCGLAVDWVRASYQARWRLFRDSDYSVPGRYYFSPAGTPFVSGWHQLGSATWDDKNWPAVHPLGEVPGSYAGRDNAEPPTVLPAPLQVGRDDCIENGEMIAEAVPYDLQVNGWPSGCFPPGEHGISDWQIVSAYTSCSLQFFYAVVIGCLYRQDSASVITAFGMLVPDGVVTVHPRAGFFPGVATVICPDCSVAVVEGTTDEWQLALQAFTLLAPPVNYGILSTLPLWYSASQWIHNALVADGSDPNKPIILVGHSYGAVAACVLAARYRSGIPSRQVAVLTFGCPKLGDERFKTLLEETAFLGLADVGDLVTVLPPDLLTLYPVMNFLGLGFLTVWTRWISQPSQLVLNDDGSLVNGNPVVLDFPTMLALTQDVLLGIPISRAIAHDISIYAERTVTRCPTHEWPINEPLWNWLRGIPFPALGAIGLSAARFSSRSGLGLLGAAVPAGSAGVGLGSATVGQGEVGMGPAIRSAAGSAAFGLGSATVAQGDVGLGPANPVPARRGALGIGATDVPQRLIGMGPAIHAAGGAIGLGGANPVPVVRGAVGLRAVDVPQRLIGLGPARLAAKGAIGLGRANVVPAGRDALGLGAARVPQRLIGMGPLVRAAKGAIGLGRAFPRVADGLYLVGPPSIAGFKYVKFVGGQFARCTTETGLPSGNHAWTLTCRLKSAVTINGVIATWGNFNSFTEAYVGSYTADTDHGRVSNGFNQCIGSTKLSDGIERFLAGVFDGTNLRFWVGTNWDSSALSATSTNVQLVGNGIYVGCDVRGSGGSGNFIHALVRDIRIYTSALSSTDLTTLGNGTEQTAASVSALHWWKATEGSGTTLADSGTGGNSMTFGTSTFAPTWSN